MGTVPTAPTFAPGESTGVAAKLNQLRDVHNFWASPPRCYAYSSTVESIPNNALTVVSFEAEVYDVVQAGDSPMHDNTTNNSRIVLRTAGTYEVSGQVTFAGSAAGPRRVADVRKNAAGSGSGGTRIAFSQQAPIASASFATSVPVPVVEFVAAAGDYLELFGLQDTGGSLNTVATQVDTFLRVRLIAG